MTQQLPQLGIRFGFIPSFVLCVAVLVSLAVPAFLQIGGWATDTRFLDNRPAIAFPGLPKSLEDISQFRDDLAKFVDDRFGLRAELVKLNIRLNHLIGVSKIPNMVVGKGGWTFLKEGSDGFDQFRGLNRFTDANLDRWIDIMEKLQRWTALHGSKFMIVIAPNQQTIYPEYMPGYITRVVPETRLDQLVRRLRERNSPLVFVDPRADLWAARRRVQLYSRYENHWNQVGGFVAYLATMRAAERLLPGIPNLKDEDITVGTSWRSWQNPPFGERVFTVTLKFPSRVTGTEVIAAAGPEKISKVTTGLDQAPSVLLYGDSFGVLGLLAYLKESFRWSMYVPTAHVSFPFDLIERHKPDLVILEMVERFLSGYLPDDPRADRDLLLREAPPFEMAVKSKELAGGGYIEGVINEGNDTVLFPGWAMDPSDRTPARGIFAYQSGRVVGVAWPTMRRPDLAAGAPSDLVAFRMPVPLAVAREPLSFFSVNRGGTIRPLVVIPEAAAQIDALKR